MGQSANIESWFAEAIELDAAGRERLFRRVGREDEDSERRLRDFVRALDDRPGFLTTAPEISGEDLEEWFGSGERGRPDAGSLAFLASRDRIAGYELLHVIGYGGMGVVYEAMQQQPRRRVALKLLRATEADPSILRRFEAEAEILARLRHPSIAQVFEAGVEQVDGEPVPYLAMELIPEARTIARFVEEEELDEAARLRLFLEVASAVEHANEQGVVHRDLKPANILVDPTGSPKIIDFGIARIVDGDEPTHAVTQTRGVLGTLSYMSPEQLGADELAVDRRTDVYALGVVLYELLWNALPYDVKQASMPTVVRAIVHQPPLPPGFHGATAPRDLETILLKALRKTRDDRYPSAAEFADDLRRYLEHEPIAARPPSLTYRLRLLSRRRPGLLAGGLAAVVLITASIVVSGWLWQRGELLQIQADDARSELREVRAALGGGDRSRADFEPFASGILASVEDSLAAADSDEERARLLTWAVDTLQRLEPQGEADPELLAGIADTYIDLGAAYGDEWEAGPEKVAGAVGAFRRAEEICRRLADADPEDFDARLRLSHAQGALSQTLRKMQRFEDAFDVAEHSVANAEAAESIRPGDVDANSRLIAALWARGDAHIGLDSGRAGLDDSLRARAIAREMLDLEGESRRAVHLMAWSAFRIGAWYMHTMKDSRAALEAHVEANDLRLSMVELAPERACTAEDLLWYTGAEIGLLESLEGPARAAERLREFIDGAAEAAESSGTREALEGSFAGAEQRLDELLKKL